MLKPEPEARVRLARASSLGNQSQKPEPEYRARARGSSQEHRTSARARAETPETKADSVPGWAPSKSQRPAPELGRQRQRQTRIPCLGGLRQRVKDQSRSVTSMAPRSLPAWHRGAYQHGTEEPTCMAPRSLPAWHRAAYKQSTEESNNYSTEEPTSISPRANPCASSHGATVSSQRTGADASP